MHDVFRAGVEPGGLTADYEVKMMICCILEKVARPMPVSALIEVFVAEAIGNYFEVASAAAAMVESGSIAIEEYENERCYVITPTGAQAAVTLEKDLPTAVRERGVKAAEHFFLQRERRARNKTSIEKVEDGFLLTLSITDVGSDLLRVTILLPDEKTCKQLENRFISDPIVVYKGVVALLTGNYQSVGALLDEAEPV